MMKRSRSVTVSITLLAFLSIGIANVANAAQATEITRHMARGAAAMELAESPADFLDAVEEFSEAVKLAPDLDAAWFNLGLAQEMAEQYQASILSFRVYLEKSPQASDREAVEARIFGLEYKMENQAKQLLSTARQEIVEVTRTRQYSGSWETADHIHTMTIEVGYGQAGCRVVSSGRGANNAPDMIRRTDSCRVEAAKLILELYGKGHGIEYTQVCAYTMNQDGKILAGEYLSGKGGRKRGFCEGGLERR